MVSSKSRVRKVDNGEETNGHRTKKHTGYKSMHEAFHNEEDKEVKIECMLVRNK